MLSDSEINEGLALAEKATPGPWEVNSFYTVDGGGLSRYVESESGTICNGPKVPGDMELIAAARTLLPAALTELLATRKELADLREKLPKLAGEWESTAEGRTSYVVQAYATCAARLREIGGVE